MPEIPNPEDQIKPYSQPKAPLNPNPIRISPYSRAPQKKP